MLIKEYKDESTEIKIFDDYCSTYDDDIDVKNTIATLLLRIIKNKK